MLISILIHENIFIAQKFTPEIGTNSFIISVHLPCCLRAAELVKQDGPRCQTVRSTPPMKGKISATFIRLFLEMWNFLNGARGHKRGFYAALILWVVSSMSSIDGDGNLMGDNMGNECVLNLKKKILGNDL